MPEPLSQQSRTWTTEELQARIDELEDERERLRRRTHEIQEAADKKMGKVDRLQARVDELEQGMAAEARIVEAQTLDVKALGKGRREILRAQVKRMRECALGGDPRRYVKYHERDWRALLRRDIEDAQRWEDIHA